MEIIEKSTKKSKLTLYIVISMILGILAGYYVHENYGPETQTTFANNAKLLTTIFLRLVQIIRIHIISLESNGF